MGFYFEICFLFLTISAVFFAIVSSVTTEKVSKRLKRLEDAFFLINDQLESFQRTFQEDRSQATLKFENLQKTDEKMRDEMTSYCAKASKAIEEMLSRLEIWQKEQEKKAEVSSAISRISGEAYTPISKDLKVLRERVSKIEARVTKKRRQS